MAGESKGKEDVPSSQDQIKEMVLDEKLDKLVSRDLQSRLETPASMPPPPAPAPKKSTPKRKNKSKAAPGPKKSTPKRKNKSKAAPGPKKSTPKRKNKSKAAPGPKKSTPKRQNGFKAAAATQNAAYDQQQQEGQHVSLQAAAATQNPAYDQQQQEGQYVFLHECGTENGQICFLVDESAAVTDVAVYQLTGNTDFQVIPCQEYHVIGEVTPSSSASADAAAGTASIPQFETVADNSDEITISESVEDCENRFVEIVDLTTMEPFLFDRNDPNDSQIIEACALY